MKSVGHCVRWVVVVGIVAMTMLTSSKADEQQTILPSFRCEAYGRLVECRASNTGNQAIEWAAICPQAKPEIYRSAGDVFSFRFKGRTQIEMHLPYIGGFTPLRAWAVWYRGRVVFQPWVEPAQ